MYIYLKKKEKVPIYGLDGSNYLQELNCFCLTLCESSMMVSAPLHPTPSAAAPIGGVLFLFICSNYYYYVSFVW